MWLTCSECEKKLKLADDSSAKKIKCPECGTVNAVPSPKAPAKKKPTTEAKNPAAPAKKKPPRVDEDDEDRDERPTKKASPKKKTKDDDDEAPEKSGRGMLLVLLGGGAAFLILFLAVVGVGVWYFLLRNPTEGPVGPGGGTQISLSNARIERVGDQIQLSVDYHAAKVLDSDRVGCYVVFPNDPTFVKLVKISQPKDLQITPQGRWVSQPFPVRGHPAENAKSCDIVIRIGPEFNALNQEITRLPNIAIPQSQVASEISNVVVKRSSTEPDGVEFSFHHKLTGPLPTAKFMVFEVDFVDPAGGKKQRALIARRTGDAIKSAETITGSARCPFPKGERCDLLVSDRQNGTGNFAVAANVPIQAAAAPPTSLVTLSNAIVEYESTANNPYKVSVDLLARQEPRPGLYRCWVVFSDEQGRKQKAISIGNPLSAQALKAGTQVVVDNIGMPPVIGMPSVTSKKACDLIVTDEQGTTVGQLLDVPINNAKKKKPLPLVLVRNVQIDKIDGTAVRVRLDYEFTREPAKNMWYYFKIMHGTPKATITGAYFHVEIGAKLPPKGSIDKVYRQGGIGGYDHYRIWVTRWEDNFSDPFIAPKVSDMLLVKAGTAETPSDVVLANVTVEKVDDGHVRVAVDYEFFKEIDPKKGYAILVQRADVDTSKVLFNPTVRQELGEKWQKKGQVKAEVPADGKGAQYRVWMVQSGVTISNTPVVNVGQTGSGGLEPIEISSAKITSFGKKGSVVAVSFKFTGFAKPNPKGVYTFVLHPKGGKAFAFFQVIGAKMATQGTFPFQTAFVRGNQAEIEVYILDSSNQNRLASNRKVAELR